MAAGGDQYRLRGQPTLAEPLLRESLRLTEAHFAHDRDRLIAALNALGLVCKDLAKYDEASACYRRALAVLEAAGETSSANVATLYHNLGGIEHARGNYAAGESLARKGIELRRAAAADDRTLAADMVALAAILDGLERFDEAESLYLDALGMLERSPSKNAHEIGVALNDLGANNARRGRLDEAEALLTRALSVKRRACGAEHPDVALSLNNLAYVYERKQAVTRALELYAEALRIFERAIGPEHPKTLDCRRNYERALALSSRM